MITFQKTKLNNGLQIITAPMKETKAVTILFLFRAGSRYESEKQNGLAHFLEHMVFKGSKKYPTALDISKELDGLGAKYNAFTAEEQTGFYISSSADHFSKIVAILTEIIFSSRFTPSEIAKEKKVILEEINMYKDLPQAFIFDLAKRLFYGNTALGRSTLGEVQTVKAFQQQDLSNFVSAFYQPRKMVAAIAGNGFPALWRKEIKKRINHQYTNLTNFTNLCPTGQVQDKQKSAASLVYFKKTDQAHLLMGFRTFSRFDQRRYILRIMDNLLGGVMSSRLFTEVREKRGLAYYVGSTVWEFNDCGAILANAGLDIKRIEKAIKVILAEFSRFTQEKVSSKELNKAKENLKGHLYLDLEDSFSIAEFLADQELLWRKIEQPEEIIKKVFAVTAQDIRDLAQDIFLAKNLNLAIIGPFTDKEKFAKIINKY